MLEVPEVVQNKARNAGAGDWLRGLDDLVAGLAEAWSLTVTKVYDEGTEALVAAVDLTDGTPAVLKVLVPGADDATAHEMTVLRLVDGDGCVRLLHHDEGRGAMLVERLGPSMHQLGVAFDERLPALADLAKRVWRPASGSGLPTGAEKCDWLADHTVRSWDVLDQPCAERTVADALACLGRRRAAHDDERAVLVHGDIHQWNALRSGDGWALIDPDGLLAEPEYDLGILMREDPAELLAGDPWDRARFLAQRCGCDATAVWEWGVIERVSTGLVCLAVGLEAEGREMLHAADVVSTLH